MKTFVPLVHEGERSILSCLHPSFEEHGKRERAVSGSRKQQPQLVQQERPSTDEISPSKSKDDTRSSQPFAAVADIGHCCPEGVRLRSTGFNLMVNVPATVHCCEQKIAPRLWVNKILMLIPLMDCRVHTWPWFVMDEFEWWSVSGLLSGVVCGYWQRDRTIEQRAKEV